MARRFSTEQALEQILEPREDLREEAIPEASSPYSSSPEDTSDTEWEVTMESSYSSDSSEREERGETTGPKWTSKNGLIYWSASNTETLRYFPANCLPSGPTRYAITRITEEVKSCWDLFITDDVMQLIIQMTTCKGDVPSKPGETWTGRSSRHSLACSFWPEFTGPVMRAPAACGMSSQDVPSSQPPCPRADLNS